MPCRKSNQLKFTADLIPSLGLLFTLFFSQWLLFFSPPSFAATLPNFKATYEVDAFDIILGKANYAFNCQQTDCTLTSSAKPSGLARLFTSDSSYETAKFTQTKQDLTWLSYHKLGLSEKNGKTIEKTVTLTREERQKRIWHSEKEKAWPIQTNIYDLMSIAFAIQYYKLNNRPLPELNLYIQDNNFQESIAFETVDKAETIGFEFADDELEALRYTFASHNSKIELWLLENHHYFPGRIRITNKEEDRTITLNLAELPHIL